MDQDHSEFKMGSNRQIEMREMSNFAPSKENLFVYGSLKYKPARDLLGDCVFVQRSSVKGKLFLVENQYPGYVPGRGLVFGEIYAVENGQFDQIDEYEGDLYLRRKIMTTSQIECWIYEYIRS